jgi:predicted transposase YbfD/YdcC
MENQEENSLVQAFVSIPDPRQQGKIEHNLVEMLVIAVSAVLSGANSFAEIEAWADAKIDWLRQYLTLKNGIPSHDTFGRLFAMIDPEKFEQAFRQWVLNSIPNMGSQVIAIDGKTSRRSGSKIDKTALHLVSAFATETAIVVGQKATDAKSNEKKAIPELLATLAIKGCTVTIDAMGTQANIAQAICDKEADYVLAVKDNQPLLAESIRDFYDIFKQEKDKTPHSTCETIEKDHGRIEVRRCYAFNQIDCLSKSEQWKNLKSFCVIETERTVNEKTSYERRLYISSLPADAQQLLASVRAHWRVENNLHWCLDVMFNDDQSRMRTDYAAHNFALVRHITLNLIRLHHTPKKQSINIKRLRAAAMDDFRAEIMGLVST